MAARKKVSKKSARKTKKRGSKRKPARKASKKKVSKKKPAKKKASKKKKKAGKKAGKKVSRKKTSKKKSKKKASKKKAKKKPARKKKAAKKKKKVSKKKPAKKTKKKVSKKKTKKKTSRKKPARKKVSKKKARKKKPAKKKAAAKKAATKKAAAKKAAADKQSARRKILTKDPVVRNLARNAVPAPMNPADHVPTRTKRRRKPVNDQLIHGIEPYRPKKGEEYMSDEQLEHFREILGAWKTELMQEVDRTVHHMQDEASNFPDPNDRATQESEFGLELRTRDRERKLLKKIDQAIARTEDGTYGYCEETGEAIGLKRLEARPVATLSVEAQERREVAERQYRDQDDRYR
ncbi:MAG: RNA polymerase-binding protein DksA [Gammaproteobacteria bacterium]|jgi:DnaK suppressor protein|nr:RNA polymerase-binding protein DksA [Gammaproteobacteria bacterium]